MIRRRGVNSEMKDQRFRRFKGTRSQYEIFYKGMRKNNG